MPMLSEIVVLNDHAAVEGGGSKVAILSACALARRGHRVLFFAAVGPVDPLLQASGARIVCLGQPDLLGDPNPLSAAARGLWNGRAAAALAVELASLDPTRTIVHLHNWTKALSTSVVHAARSRGFAIVATLHDYAAACPAGGFYDFRREQICSRRPMSLACIATNCDARRYGHKLWRVARTALRNVAGGFPRGVSRFVCVSDTSQALCAPHLPAGATIHRIDNPIDVPRTPPADVGRNRPFVAVGRLAAEKGVRLFAQAAQQAGVEAVFAGDGYLRDAVHRLAPTAEITGWLDAAAVVRRLRQARALVFPSQWPETQGLVVLEAAACGVPAIVSDGCAAREWIRDGVDGLLFRSGDIADLRDKLALLADGALAARLGQSAYERYWRHAATPERHADELARVYRTMLDDRQVASGGFAGNGSCLPA